METTTNLNWLAGFLPSTVEQLKTGFVAKVGLTSPLPISRLPRRSEESEEKPTPPNSATRQYLQISNSALDQQNLLNRI